ncbi:MAG: hypothetical protein KQH63_04980 [Desulfobulbaceae bacterium]|nr:hypothetical protein [Desulfobulbaceae bacterium]
MIDLDIPQKPTYVQKRFKLNSEIESLFSQYLEAARSTRKDLTESELLEAILLKHINKDRAFKDWRKKQQEQ